MSPVVLACARPVVVGRLLEAIVLHPMQYGAFCKDDELIVLDRKVKANRDKPDIVC